MYTKNEAGEKQIDKFLVDKDAAGKSHTKIIYRKHAESEEIPDLSNKQGTVRRTQTGKFFPQSTYVAKKAHIDLEPALKKSQELRSSGIGAKLHISKELTLDELPEVTVEEQDDNYIYDKNAAAMDTMKKASTTRAKFTRSSEDFNSFLTNDVASKRDAKND